MKEEISKCPLCFWKSIFSVGNHVYHAGVRLDFTNDGHFVFLGGVGGSPQPPTPTHQKDLGLTAGLHLGLFVASDRVSAAELVSGSALKLLR